MQAVKLVYTYKHKQTPTFRTIGAMPIKPRPHGQVYRFFSEITFKKFAIIAIPIADAIIALWSLTYYTAS